MKYYVLIGHTHDAFNGSICESEILLISNSPIEDYPFDPKWPYSYEVLTWEGDAHLICDHKNKNFFKECHFGHLYDKCETCGKVLKRRLPE